MNLLHRRKQTTLESGDLAEYQSVGHEKGFLTIFRNDEVLYWGMGRANQTNTPRIEIGGEYDFRKIVEILAATHNFKTRQAAIDPPVKLGFYFRKKR